MYNALTSKRPYKEPYSHAKAHEYMRGGIDSLFDRTVVEALEQVVPMYPPGVEVLLSNGEEGLVLDQTDNPNRPIIRIEETKEVVNLSTDTAYQGVEITASGIATYNYSSDIAKLNEDRTSVRQRKKKILVVDQSKLGIMQVTSYLGDEYEIISELKGLDAIARIKKDPIDLLIINPDLPVVSGISVVRTLRDNGYTQLPVIFVSDKADVKTVMQSRSVHASDFIIKPANPTYVQERVRAILSGNKNMD